MKVDGDDFYVTTTALSLKDHRGLTISNLNMLFSSTANQMRLENLILETPDSKIEGEILFSYEDGGLDDFENKVDIDAIFRKAIVSTNDLIPFYNEFGKNQKIKLKNTKVIGTLNDFKIININASGLDRSIIQGNIRIKDVLSDSDKFYLEADFDNLSTNYYDLINLLPNILGESLPKELYQFGSVKIKGNSIVTTKDVDLDVEVFSHLGKINAFVLLNGLDNIKNAEYNGNVISNNFNVGQLLNKKALGNAGFDIHVDGKGFTLANLDTKVEGEINKLEFNGYTYTKLNVMGILKDPVFDGKLISNDPNAKFKFNGVVDASKEINNYDFVTSVEHADLKRLNLFGRDSLSVFNGNVMMKMKGTNINNMFGTISFEKTLYKNQNSDYYFEDFTITSSFDDQNVRTITMNSPDIIEGSVKGVFRFENVYDLFRNSIGSLYTNFEASEVTVNEFMEFNFNIYNKIVEVFFPKIEFAPNTFIKGKVESNDSEFKLTFKSPSIKTFDSFMKAVDVQIDNKNPLFNTYIAIGSVYTKQYNISKFSLINVTLNDTLHMRSEFKGGLENEDEFNLAFYHTINEENNSVLGFKKSDFLFKGYKWGINQEKSKAKNQIIFDNNFRQVDINSIKLNHENEEINIDGIAIGKDYKDIKVNFNDVDFNKITPNIDGLVLGGRVVGDLSIFQDNGKYFPSSTIVIKDLSVNNDKLGELKFNVSGNEELTRFSVNSKLVNNKLKTMSAIGFVNVSETNSNMDIDVNFNSLDISGFSALGEGIFSDLRGEVSGDVNVSGSYKNPSIDGVLSLNKSGLKIPYLNIDLDFDKDARVILKKQQFIFDNINVIDTKYNTEAVLGGFIEHQGFSKWRLALDIIAKNRFLVLDTVENEESLYYGTGFISGEASIKGPINEIVIDVNAKTEKGTVFNIPLNETESIGDNSFIHFLSPEEKKARLRGKEIVLKEIKGLELNFELDVTHDAEVEVVIDKNTGSSLKGRGAGTLLIEINTNGKFKMWGDFVAYQGTYNFRYGAFVEKVFKVREGGTINWEGNPLNARLDLDAIYKTEANPAILLENATLNRKTPVEVIVDLKGELEKPNIKFEIQFPNMSSVVKSELESKLESDSDKSLQAISLLTQGQFYNELKVGSNAVTGNLVERASSLVNDIFSDKEDKFQVGLNYVKGEKFKEEETSDEVGVTVSTKINNRILINGSVGVPIGGVSESAIVGNVEVEYLFNEEGSLKGKIFNRENDIQYIGETQGYKQGAGLSYSVDFDDFNELLSKILKKKKTEDSLINPIDTIKVEKPKFINFTDKKE